MTKHHNMGSFSRKLKPLLYTGNNQSIEIALSMTHRDSQTIFNAEVKEHDIRASNKNVDELYAEVCRRLDEKTDIEWHPHILIQCEAGTMTDLDEDVGYSNAPYRVQFQIEAEKIDVGRNSKGQKFYRENGFHIRDGEPATGKNLRGSEWMGLALDTIDALVVDTPENREALQLLALEFEKIKTKLTALLDQKTVQHTLTAAVARGLLTAGSGESRPQPRAKSRKKR